MSDQTQPADPATTAGNQPTVAERAAAGKRRGQAFIGAAAGAVVVAVIVGVFVWVGVNDDDNPAAAPAPATSAAAPPAEAPVEAPSANPGEAPSAPPGETAAAPPPGAGIDQALATKPVVKAGTGTLTKLAVKPLITGKGPKVETGQTLTVNYVGVLFANGEEFDASWKTGQPAQFPIGVGQVIKGWDQGLVGVPVGSRVQLDIPAVLAYGDPAPDGYPEGALRFVVDILGAQ